MKKKLLDVSTVRTFALVLDPGDEVTESILRFAREEGLTGASFTAIGAFSDAVVAFFDPGENEYREIPIDEQVEVLTLAGNIGLHEGAPKLHAHVVLGRRDGSTRGGHLMKAHVRPTLEIVVEETPAYLRRKEDPRTGLPLIDLSG